MTDKHNPAEIADRHNKLIVLASFLVALKYIVSASELIVGSGASRILSVMEIGLMLGAVGIILPIMAWKIFRLKESERKKYFDPYGYLFSLLKKSMSKSWTITFVALVFCEIFTKNLLAGLPPLFFIHATLALLLGTFSVSFFVLDRQENADDPEGE